MPRAVFLFLLLGAEKFFVFADFVVVIICYLFLSRQSWKLSIILNTKDCVKTGWHLNRIKKKTQRFWEFQIEKKWNICIYYYTWFVSNKSYNYLIAHAPIHVEGHGHKSLCWLTILGAWNHLELIQQVTLEYDSQH